MIRPIFDSAVTGLNPANPPLLKSRRLPRSSLGVWRIRSRTRFTAENLWAAPSVPQPDTEVARLSPKHSGCPPKSDALCGQVPQQINSENWRLRRAWCPWLRMASPVSLKARPPCLNCAACSSGNNGSCPLSARQPSWRTPRGRSRGSGFRLDSQGVTKIVGWKLVYSKSMEVHCLEPVSRTSWYATPEPRTLTPSASQLS